jgi:hypothetical protein
LNKVERKLIEYLESEHEFAQMVLWNDEKLGLEISLIIDDTTLGPGWEARAGAPTPPEPRHLSITAGWPGT